MKGSIVFLDSGVGGLPYLEGARNLIPGASLHYIVDDAGFPYGTKAPRGLEEILLDRVRRIRARLMPDVLVIACDTASQVGLKVLRKAHPELSIVGTVPAIKPAAESTRTGRIGVMATERAIDDPCLDDLIARFAPELDVVKLPAQDLVSFVERRYLDSTAEERRAAVSPYVREFIARGVDRIVLACTHFLHLEKDIADCAKAFGSDDVEIVESRQGAVKRAAQMLAETNVPSGAAAPGQAVTAPGQAVAKLGLFFLTGNPPFDPSYARWAERFGLAGPERL